MEEINTLANTPEKRNIGETIWFIEPYSGCIHEGKIEEFLKTEVHGITNDCAWIKASHFGSTGRLFDLIFLTEEDARKFIQQEEDNLSQTYRKQISNVEDLVRFMYDHTVSCGEDTDWTARKIVKEKAMEFGIKLED